MTYSAPAKLSINRVLNQTVQVAYHHCKPLRLSELDDRVGNFIGLDIKHSLGRPTVFADINVTQHISPEDGWAT